MKLHWVPIAAVLLAMLMSTAVAEANAPNGVADDVAGVLHVRYVSIPYMYHVVGPEPHTAHFYWGLRPYRVSYQIRVERILSPERWEPHGTFLWHRLEEVEVLVEAEVKGGASSNSIAEVLEPLRNLEQPGEYRVWVKADCGKVQCSGGGMWSFMQYPDDEPQ